MNTLNNYTQAQKQMLHYVFNHGKVSRSELSSALNVSTLTVINGVKKLLEDGMLVECGTLPSERGRRVTLLSINPELHYFISVDIGAYSTKLAVLRFDGSIVHKEQLVNATRDVRKCYLTPSTLRSQIQLLLTRFGKDRISALCFAISGTVDYAAKQSRFCTNITGWSDVDFQKEFGDHFNLPVYLDSSGHCFAIAERQFGQGRDVSDLMVVSIGSSICTGIILGDKLLRGVSGAAGELGHVQDSVRPTFHNWQCTCGKRHCLELHATATCIRTNAIRDYAAQHPGWSITAEQASQWMATAYENKEPAAVNAVSTAAQVLGRHVANVANILNPRMIVFGGGVIYAYPDMVDLLRQQILSTALPMISQELTVTQSSLEPDAALLGAALLAIYDLLNITTDKTL